MKNYVIIVNPERIPWEKNIENVLQAEKYNEVPEYILKFTFQNPL